MEAQAQHASCALQQPQLQAGVVRTSPLDSEPACWWCRGECQEAMVGCPVRFNASRVLGSYRPLGAVAPTSPGDAPASSAGVGIVQLLDTATFGAVANKPHAVSCIPARFVGLEQYDTDGQFCSFPCALAFALDAAGQPMYSNSAVYLRQLHHKLHQEQAPDEPYRPLQPAPAWRLLKAFGGPLALGEFRAISATQSKVFANEAAFSGVAVNVEYDTLLPGIE